MNTLTSKDIKEAFKAAGIKVRVRDLDNKFRICTLDETPHKPESFEVAKRIGLLNCWGLPGAIINQAYEMVGYKPGSIIRK